MVTSIEKIRSKNFIFVILAFCTLCNGIIGGRTESCTFCRKGQMGVAFVLENTARQVISRAHLSDFYVTSLLPHAEIIATEFANVGIVVYVFKKKPKIVEDNVPPQMKTISLYNANADKYNPPRFLGVWILYVFNEAANIDFEIKVLKRSVEIVGANTVKTIIFFTSETKNLIVNLNKLRDAFPPGKYNLSYYSVSGTINEHDCKFLRFFDSITYHENYATKKRSILQGNMETQLKILIHHHRQTEKMCNQTFKIIVCVRWSDTVSKYESKYKATADFWKAYEKFAYFSNVSVLFFAAFDQYGLRDTSGWWHVSESEENGLTFTSKKSLAQTEQTVKECYHYSMHGDYDFKNNRSCIYINQYIEKYADLQKHKNKTTVIRDLFLTVFSRFSCFVYEPVVSIKPNISTDFDGISLLQLVANLNLEGNQTYYQIIILSSSDDEAILFLVAKQITNINKIWPATITKLVFRHPKPSKQLAHFRQVIGMLPNSLELGTRIHSSWFSHFFKYTTNNTLQLRNFSYLEHDIIYIEHVPGFTILKGYKYGLDKVLEDTISVFEYCKRVLKVYTPRINVGLITGYPDTMEHAKNDYASLVVYWREISIWATKTHTNVIFINAVDYIGEVSNNVTQRRTEVYNMQHLGWWKTKLVNGTWELEENLEVVRKRQPKAKLIVKKSSITSTVVLSVTVPLVLIIIMLVVTFIIYKMRTRTVPVKCYIDDNDICTDHLILLTAATFVPSVSTPIGSGNFGTVYKCYMSHFTVPVAVKIPNSDKDSSEAAVRSLVMEIKVMSSVGIHENILTLLGVCVENALFAVTEFCKNGSLINYLRSQVGNAKNVSSYELYKFCHEITQGLKHLHDQDIIHGDLSTRNVLLTSSYTCKISDFGLARQLEAYKVYTKKGEEPLPWRWMAIESLEILEFSTHSDIWGLGVTFWEIFTLGRLPYADISFTDSFVTRLADGLRLEQTRLCSDAMYNLMMSCWRHLPAERESPADLLTQLTNLMKKEYVAV